MFAGISWADSLNADSAKLNILLSANPSYHDSSEIDQVKPTLEKEKSVFEGYDSYNKKAGSAESMLERFLEWLAELLFDKAGPENIITARRIIIWAIVVISAVVVVWLLMRSKVSSLIKTTPTPAAFNFADITEDLNTLNFIQKINEALQQNDFRLAVRWHYLKILFLLDRNGLIRFAPHKTNIDYNNELLSKEQSGADNKAKLTLSFRSLSRVYEFVWYGQFSITENDYKVHAGDFDEFESRSNV